jgi:hypothetical protein
MANEKHGADRAYIASKRFLKMAANDNRDKLASAEKALANLRKHRDDLIRALAEQYDEADARGRLDKLPKVVAAIKAVKKAMEEREDEQRPNKDQPGAGRPSSSML